MTIKDLVALSGYSLGTVSRVLNNRPNVSEKARKAVLAVAEEYGFELNANAQSLKQQKGNGVLIVVKGTHNEMFSGMVERYQKLFSGTDRPLLVDFIDEAEDEVQRAAHLCRERKSAGVLFLGGTNANFSRGFAAIPVPAVVVTNDASALGFAGLSSVFTDDVAGAEQAVDSLIDAGHRHIAVLGGDRELSDTSRRRFEGCRRAFEKHSLRFDEALYRTARYSFSSGYAAMEELFSAGERVSAVFAMSDVIAIGAMRCAADHGLRVPEDLSVMGYDGLELGSYCVPRLTSVTQNEELLVKHSARLLLDCMENGAPAEHIPVPFILSIKDSVREVSV